MRIDEESHERKYLHAQSAAASDMWEYFEGLASEARSNEARLKRRVVKLEAEKTNLEQRLREAERDRDLLQSYAEALLSRYRILLSSPAWRLTAPLRVLTRLALKLTGRKPRSGLMPFPKRPRLSTREYARAANHATSK